MNITEFDPFDNVRITAEWLHLFLSTLALRCKLTPDETLGRVLADTVNVQCVSNDSRITAQQVRSILELTEEVPRAAWSMSLHQLKLPQTFQIHTLVRCCTNADRVENANVVFLSDKLAESIEDDTRQRRQAAADLCRVSRPGKTPKGMTRTYE